MSAVSEDPAATTKQAVPSEAPKMNGRAIAIDREMAVKAHSAPAKLTYEIAVRTGDVTFAGTDADVYAYVSGTLGATDVLYLDNAANNFERNQTDYFYFTLNSIGTPTSCWIYFDPMGPGPDWLLKTVTVNGVVFSWTKGWISKKGWYHLQ